MNIKDMEKRSWSCGDRPFNTGDRIVVEEIWLSTIEVCKRLDALMKHRGVSMEIIPDTKLVAKLRELTGQSMTDCKKALIDCDWYYSGAVDLLKARNLTS